MWQTIKSSSYCKMTSETKCFCEELKKEENGCESQEATDEKGRSEYKEDEHGGVREESCIVGKGEEDARKEEGFGSRQCKAILPKTDEQDANIKDQCENDEGETLEQDNCEEKRNEKDQSKEDDYGKHNGYKKQTIEQSEKEELRFNNSEDECQQNSIQKEESYTETYIICEKLKFKNEDDHRGDEECKEREREENECKEDKCKESEHRQEECDLDEQENRNLKQENVKEKKCEEAANDFCEEEEYTERKHEEDKGNVDKGELKQEHFEKNKSKEDAEDVFQKTKHGYNEYEADECLEEKYKTDCRQEMRDLQKCEVKKYQKGRTEENAAKEEYIKEDEIKSKKSVYDNCEDFRDEISRIEQEECKEEMFNTTIHQSVDEIKRIAENIFDIILEDWMHGYEQKDLNHGLSYSKHDYSLLFTQISQLISKGLPVTFLIPAFPAKSSNKDSKVLGVEPDFAEYLAIRSLVTTVRKMEAISSTRIVVIILSDYHTFDEFVNVKHQDYKIYRMQLLKMIYNAGADDIIKIFTLSDFPEFKRVPCFRISTILVEKYGEPKFLVNLIDSVKQDPKVCKTYLGIKRFMLDDLSGRLPGARNSKTTKRLIRDVTRGMMRQGDALDRFLRQQSTITNFIRLSIHNHHPSCGKNAIDLYKHVACSSGVLRTPWHHAVVFDTMTGMFTVDQKRRIVGAHSEQASLLMVRHRGIDWFYLRLYFADESLTRPGKLESKSRPRSLYQISIVAQRFPYLVILGIGPGAKITLIFR